MAGNSQLPTRGERQSYVLEVRACIGSWILLVHEFVSTTVLRFKSSLVHSFIDSPVQTFKYSYCSLVPRFFSSCRSS